MKLDDITYTIRGAVFEVNKLLGHGFLEKVYENALITELRLKGLKAESQVPLKPRFREKMREGGHPFVGGNKNEEKNFHRIL